MAEATRRQMRRQHSGFAEGCAVLEQGRAPGSDHCSQSRTVKPLVSLSPRAYISEIQFVSIPSLCGIMDTV